VKNKQKTIMKTKQTIAGWLALAAPATRTRYKTTMLRLFLLLVVAGAAVARPQSPQFTSISVSGTTLTLKAVNGVGGGQFVLLASTNVSGPWTGILTNNYDGSGNLNLSFPITNSAVHQQFYLLKQ
jgi:hypothetical protein